MQNSYIAYMHTNKLKIVYKYVYIYTFPILFVMNSYILATIWSLKYNFESMILMQELCIYIKPSSLRLTCPDISF